MVESNLYIPPNEYTGKDPVLFLAGPIQGADWQEKAIEHIHSLNPNVIIASPKRPESFEKGDIDEYNRQVDWETHHLKIAGKNGVIMFWLANELTHHPERAYAQTTRAELFEWKKEHEYNNAKLVIGIDDNFPGTKYIRRRFSQDCPNVPLLDTLEETCRIAVKSLL